MVVRITTSSFFSFPIHFLLSFSWFSVPLHIPYKNLFLCLKNQITMNRFIVDEMRIQKSPIWFSVNNGFSLVNIRTKLRINKAAETTARSIRIQKITLGFCFICSYCFDLTYSDCSSKLYILVWIIKACMEIKIITFRLLCQIRNRIVQ